jgi:hypothetical protein
MSRNITGPFNTDGTPLPCDTRDDNVVGKRILAKVGHRYGKNVDEFRVLELSPSKRWTRLMNVNGGQVLGRDHRGRGGRGPHDH